MIDWSKATTRMVGIGERFLEVANRNCGADTTTEVRMAYLAAGVAGLAEAGAFIGDMSRFDFGGPK